MRSAALRLLLCVTLSTLLIVPAASGHEEAPQSAVPTPESVLGQPVGADFSSLPTTSRWSTSAGSTPPPIGCSSSR